ncbi:MAG: helix-turn-helix transcriptional regulator [Spirochaetales bacterium]|nr:helix-turn-helix transcriptional regulator [Spirochaetales bacterium]
MINKIPKKMLLGFMQVHILIQAKKEPFFGLWMIDQLKNFGYEISPGTLYPILSKMESENLLIKDTKLINGKNRIYYSITESGIKVLDVAKDKAMLLFNELVEN